MSLLSFLATTFERWLPARKLTVIPGDTLPPRMPVRRILLAKDANEPWCVGLQCPCGCERRIELLVIPEAKPRWDVEVDQRGRPTLTPSVWLRDGCKSHFWLRRGRIEWCK